MRYPPLDADVHETIVEALRNGHFIDTAAALAGCSKAQAHRWLRAGAQADADADLRRFAIEANQAVAEAEDKALSYLREAVEAGDLKAVTWFLERRYPEHWAPKIQHVVRQEVGDILDRVESLEGELGREVVDRVLSAVAGEWGPGEGETEEAEGESVH